MASRVRLSLPCPEAAEPERPPPALTRDLLEEIFLRLASPADLARASAACVYFSRLIADHKFLRRYRSIHPPLLLGYITFRGFHPVQAPHPSAAVARAVARAAEFSFDYLPRPTTEGRHWRVCDVRDSRVLVQCCNPKGAPNMDLAVCDPLSQRYLLLPPITDDLLASIERQNKMFFPCGATFIPSGPSRGIEEDTSFRVIRWAQSYARLGVFVFSSVSGCWTVSVSTNREALGLNIFHDPVLWQCMHDCFFWKLYSMGTLIKLDMNTMQFCTVDLPPDHEYRQIVIVESGRNKAAMFSLDDESDEGTSVDYYTFSQNGSEKSRQWHMMSTTPLPANYNIDRSLKGPTEGYIFLEGTLIGQDAKPPVEVLSLEIKSFKIERACIKSLAFGGHPYFGFPPSMSPIRVQGYIERRWSFDFAYFAKSELGLRLNSSYYDKKTSHGTQTLRRTQSQEVLGQETSRPK